MAIALGGVGSVITGCVTAREEIGWWLGDRGLFTGNLELWTAAHFVGSAITIATFNRDLGFAPLVTHSALGAVTQSGWYYVTQQIYYWMYNGINPVNEISEDKSIGDFIEKYGAVIVASSALPLGTALLAAAFKVPIVATSTLLMVSMGASGTKEVLHSAEIYWDGGLRSNSNTGAGIMYAVTALVMGAVLCAPLGATDPLVRTVQTIGKIAAAISLGADFGRLTKTATQLFLPDNIDEQVTDYYDGAVE
jgi:hypothetical protein